MSEKLTLGTYNTCTGDEDGDNSPPGERNEPEHEPRLGTDESEEVQFDKLEGSDIVMNIEQVQRRFSDWACVRLRPRTQQSYLWVFRRLEAKVGLLSLERKQLAGTKARELIIRHLESLPRPSWRYTIGALKTVWMYGLGVPFPIDVRKDLPRLPKAGRRQTPPDEIVRAWAEAMSRESDAYSKLEWLLVAQTGWRPQHLCRVKWKHVQYDPQGRPYAIVASGVECEFKTLSPIAARLPPDVQEALLAWRETAPDVTQDRPIVPYRSVKGRVFSTTEQTTRILERRWTCLRKKYGLPQLRPCDVRHFVSTACRKAGLSKQASAVLQGHDSSQGDTMRDWYDNCSLEDLLKEQAERLPEGPLGIVLKPKVELDDSVPRDAVALLSEYLLGRLGTFEFATRMEAIRQGLRVPSGGQSFLER